MLRCVLGSGIIGAASKASLGETAAATQNRKTGYQTGYETKGGTMASSNKAAYRQFFLFNV